MRGVSRLKYSRTASHECTLLVLLISNLALSAAGSARNATNSAIPAYCSYFYTAEHAEAERIA